VGLSALGCALSFASVALADEYDATFTRAIAAKERALDLNDPAAFEQALDLFQQANRIRATKESKYELASVASRLRQDDLAVESYEAALALGLEGTAADKARAFVQENSGEMARVSVTGPAGTELYVGARRRGSLPLSTPLVVFAGKVRIRALGAGREIKRELELQKGQNAELDLEKELAAAPPSSQPPPYTAPVFTHPPVTQNPEPDRTAPLALTIGGASVAVLSIGTLVLSYSQLSTHRDRLKEVCAVPRGDDECDQANTGERAAAQDEVDSIATYRTVRTIGFVGLGAGLVASGIGIAWLAGQSKTSGPNGASDAERPTTRAFVAPTSGGFAVGFGGTLPTW
jgi:tetratricopeptide (TPR) repeat protein